MFQFFDEHFTYNSRALSVLYSTPNKNIPVIVNFTMNATKAAKARSYSEQALLTLKYGNRIFSYSKDKPFYNKFSIDTKFSWIWPLGETF